MTYLLVFFTSLITTIFLTPFLISFLYKTKIVDRPGGRKIHTDVIPRMGGLIIFFVVIIMLNAFVEDFNSIKLIIISVTILVFSGIIDDVVGLDNFIKFVVQNISAIILVYYLEQQYSYVKIFGLILSSPFDYLILLLFIIGTINSINFLDGLDGLATGFSILVFSVLLVLAIRKNDIFLILLNVALLGSTIGFLRFNAFPASIFLGDTGSLMLGFFLVLVSSLTSINYHESAFDLTFSIILLALPIIDTIKVFLVRIAKKRDPFSGDTIHQHHLLKISIVSHEATVFIIEIFSLFFILLSLVYLIDYRLEATILFFIFGIMLIVIQPLLIKLNIAEKINKLLIFVHSFPINNIFPLIKVMLLISTLLVILVSAFSFSFKTSLSTKELVFLISMVSLLLILAMYQSKKVKSFGDFYIFLNFSIFFIVSKLSLPLFYSDELNVSIIKVFHDLGFIILSALIAITLLFRWKALMTKKLFFTGVDLTLIVIMLLTFIVNNILAFDLNYYLSVSLLEAFIFYVWYKIIIDVKKQFEFSLTIGSFVLPVSLLLSLLVSNLI